MNFINFNKEKIKISKLLLLTAAVGFMMSMPTILDATAAKEDKPAGFPDLQTVIPQHLQVINSHQEEILRFTNGIANLGPGSWYMDPIFPGDPGNENGDTVLALQKIFDADKNIIEQKIVSEFLFDATHNHWHINDVALFEVREGAVDGPLVGDSVKQTFCIEDVYKLEGKTTTKDRDFWDCAVSTQGVQPGWVDQYHQSTDGQQIVITGAEPGLYYLVSISNPNGVFLETDTTNNTAWTSFELTRDSQGNPKVEAIDHSECDSPGMCGEVKANR